jgi:hypothetical protein
MKNCMTFVTVTPAAINTHWMLQVISFRFHIFFSIKFFSIVAERCRHDECFFFFIFRMFQRVLKSHLLYENCSSVATYSQANYFKIQCHLPLHSDFCANT